MELQFADSRPETCADVGLECHSCMKAAAKTLVSVCGGLSLAGVQSVFVQLYPSPACQAMAPVFASVYFQNTDAPVLPRKPMAVAAA